MDLNVVKGFFAIVEAGSMGKAAVHLRVSQSTLTRQVQALEAEIGASLLDRSGTGITPTPAGRIFLESMRAPLDAVERAIESTRRVSQGQRSLLRIGYMASIAQRYLNPALRLLREQSPTVRVQLLDASPGEQFAALRAGRIDVGVVGESGRLMEREFFVRKLATVPAVVLVPDNHPLAAQTVISLRELKGETFIPIADQDAPAYRPWLSALCRKAGFRPKVTEAAESMAHLGAMVTADHCVSLLPRFIAERPAPGLAVLAIKESFAVADLLVIWQRGKVAPPVRHLLDALFAQGSKRASG
ncbi:LysR family transcriptional regulator [Horticoccus sp. 23ND18S-11]|uniref:LysR family transcriptional regulator n=1 Tax=Horticoccus sp. 23ND18S-11 TaxID=3391832 RepID=UPI0039C9B509